MKIFLIAIYVLFFIFSIPAIAILTERWNAKRKWFLQTFFWWFLSDNIYGDRDWRPNLPNGFWRRYLWIWRNPLQNLYWKSYIKGKTSEYKGTVKYKFDNPRFGTWRTGKYEEHGDHHGKKIDFKLSPFGRQDITYIWVDDNGNKRELYRKSTCIPRRLGSWIYFHKKRRGYEHGLKQRAFSWHFRSYKLNKEGWLEWKEEEWKEITK